MKKKKKKETSEYDTEKYLTQEEVRNMLDDIFDWDDVPPEVEQAADEAIEKAENAELFRERCQLCGSTRSVGYDFGMMLCINCYEAKND